MNEIKLTQQTMDEMISKFNNYAAELDIPAKDKVTLLGMVTAMGYRYHAESVDVVWCKDCKYYGRADKRRFYRGMDCLNGHIETIVPDRDYCSRGERK